MFVTLVLATINNNKQAITPKNIVLDLGQFDGDRIKFEDCKREFDYSSRVIGL